MEGGSLFQHYNICLRELARLSGIILGKGEGDGLYTSKLTRTALRTIDDRNGVLIQDSNSWTNEVE